PIMSPLPSSTLFPYTTLFRSESGLRSVMTFLLSASTPLSPDIAFKDPLFWAMYIVHLADRGLHPETARHYISGCQTLFAEVGDQDRKSTRLNSSHLGISYAVF